MKTRFLPALLAAALLAQPALVYADNVGAIQGQITQAHGAPVNVTGAPTNGQVLQFNATTGTWVAGAAGGGETWAQTLALGASSGGTNPTITAGDVMIFASSGAASVSAANTGKLRYNSGTQTFQVSLNGAAYTDVATGAVTLQGAYDGGNTIDTGSGSAVTISSTANGATGILSVTKNPGNSQAGDAITANLGSNGTGSALYGIHQGTAGSALLLQQSGAANASPTLDAQATWNSVGTTFKGIKLNVTNTASAAASRLLDLQVGSTSLFSVGVGGQFNSGYSGVSDGSSIVDLSALTSGSLRYNLSLFDKTASFAQGTGSGIAFGSRTDGTNIAQAGGIYSSKANGTSGNHAADIAIATNSNGTIVERFRVTSLGNVVTNPTGSNLAQNATDGFLYVPVCATGAPSGTPTAITGATACVVQGSTFYFWNGSTWTGLTASAGASSLSASGDTGLSRTSAGVWTATNDSSTNYATLGANGMRFRDIGTLGWSSSGSSTAGADTAFARSAAGVIKATDGSSTNYAILGSGGSRLQAAGIRGWSSTTDATAAADVGLFRSSANTLGVNTGSGTSSNGFFFAKSVGLGATPAGLLGDGTVECMAGNGSKSIAVPHFKGPTDQNLFIAAGSAASGTTARGATFSGGPATGTDVSCSDTILAAGLPTGTGSGSLRIRSGNKIATGSTSQTVTDRVFITSNAKDLADNTITTACLIALATSNSSVGGTIHYTVRVSDSGGEEQTTRGAYYFAATNKAGSVTVTAGAVGTAVQNLVTGTDAVTITIDASGTDVRFRVTSDTSLTQVIHRIEYTICLDGGPATCTPQ